MNTKVIPIVYCFNDSFLIPAGVSIFSLLKNARYKTIYDIYILYGEGRLNNSSIETITNLKNIFPDCRITFINIGNFLKDAYEVYDFSVDVYFRLSIPSFLSQFEKVIYCDSDTIINNDLTDLFNTDINNHAIAAVKDGLAQSNKNFHSYIKKINLVPSKYINSGILIFNNKKVGIYKNLNLQIAELVSKKYRYPDQDIINTIFLNDIYFLNATYNYSLQHLMNEKKESPQIIHYIKHKPWKQVSAFGDIWWSYYRESPFYNEEYYLSQTLKIYAVIDKHLAVGNVLEKIGVYDLIIKIKKIINYMKL